MVVARFEAVVNKYKDKIANIVNLLEVKIPSIPRKSYEDWFYVKKEESKEISDAMEVDN